MRTTARVTALAVCGLLMAAPAFAQSSAQTSGSTADQGGSMQRPGQTSGGMPNSFGSTDSTNKTPTAGSSYSGTNAGQQQGGGSPGTSGQ